MKEYKTKTAFVEKITENDNMTWKLVTLTVDEDGKEKTDVKNYGSCLLYTSDAADE